MSVPQVKFSGAIILVLMILASSFIPIVQAEIYLTPEFYNPLGPYDSSNFEAGGYWTTNNGGQLSSNCFVEGDYSWYTSGGGDYYMWRYVESSMISAVAGKTVMFNFQFHPESVAIDGSQNNARAEIYYEFTSGGGGGGGWAGCPFVSVWDGNGYVLDNNVVPRAELSNGSDVRDYYKLEKALVQNDGKYTLTLSEFENEHSFLDQARLLAVDHSSSINVAVTPRGEILTYKNPISPLSATDNDGSDRLNEISLMDGDVSDPTTYFYGEPDNYLILDFGQVSADNAKLIFRTDMKKMDECILVQIRDGNGAWQTVETLVPRAYWSMEAVNLSPYVVHCRDLWIRLYWKYPHRLDFVGLDTSRQARMNLQQGELVSAVHSKSGDPTVSGAYMGDGDVRSKLLRGDGIYVELRPSEQIELAFTLPEGSGTLVRDFIFVSKGHYYTLPTGTVIDPTVFGVWVAPTELNWYGAYMTLSLPSTTTAVKVIIHGTPNFHAYIDVATLTIFDCASAPPSTYGKLTLGMNLYEWKKTTGFDPDGEVKLIPALYAEVSGGYGIRALRIKVELLPNDGSSTSQDGFFNIYYTAQGNDEEYEIDPAMTEEVQARNLETATIVIQWGTAVLIGLGLSLIEGPLGLAEIPLIAQVLERATIGTIAGATVRYSLQQFRSDPNDPHAEGDTDYFALEQWDYPSWVNEEFVPPQPWFVASATGQYTMEWSFRTSTSNDFQIRVTAFANWGEISYHPGQIHDWWTLDDRGWSNVSRVITIYA